MSNRWMPLEQRFELKVDRSPGHGPWGDCHIWTAALHGDGYGLIKVNGRYELAHRVALRLVGIEPDEDTHHRCEVKACVNTEHLRSVAHTTHPNEHRWDQCKRGHELVGENVYIRPDTGTRSCRRCRNDRSRLRREGRRLV